MRFLKSCYLYYLINFLCILFYISDGIIYLSMFERESYINNIIYWRFVMLEYKIVIKKFF